MHAQRWLMLVVLTLAGCDYSVSLAPQPAGALDPAWVGYWTPVNASESDRNDLLILPYAHDSFLVSWPAGKPGALYARATRCGDTPMPLIQLDWFGTGEGSKPDDDQTFQYARASHDGDTLRVELLNTDVISKDVKDAATLRNLLAEKAAATNLFRAPMIYQRAKNRNP